MRKIFYVLLIMISCQEKPGDIDFEVVKADSAILLKNYEPVTREELTALLRSINDTLKVTNLNVFLEANNVQKINPAFKKLYYRGYMGKMDLTSYHNDTARAMSKLRFGFGTFKGNVFVKNDNWDSLLLNNKFFRAKD